MIKSIPIPGIEDFDKPYWENCSKQKLSIQHCADCRAPRFPPRHMCPKCQSLNDEWNIVSGDAILWSFVVPRPPLLPVFENQSPYVVGLVELIEYKNIRIIGEIKSNSDIDSIKIGDTLSVRFKKINNEISLPYWVRE